MHVILLALTCFGILTLWIPEYWPVTVFQVGVYTIAAVAVWQSRNRLPAFTYPLVPLVLGVAVGLVQWFTGRTAYSFVTQTAVVQWATFLAVFVAGNCLFSDEQVSRWFRSAMLWFSFLLAVVATLQTFSSGGKIFWLFPSGYVDYVMGPFVSRNQYAAFIEAILPVAIYQALRSEHNSFLYCGMAGAMYASVIASASRAGAVLASGEILAVIVLMWARGHADIRVIGSSLLKLALLFVVFTGVVGWQSVWNRFWAPDPMAVRKELAMASVQMISVHPWFGVGLGAWPTIYPHYAIVDIGALANQAHNDWLQWAAEGGVPFGVVMAGLFVWCLRAAFRSIWGLGVISVFLHALVDYPFSRPALGSWSILVVAMLASDVRPKRARQSTEYSR